MTKKISGTKEWATHSENIQTGCEHDCKYCYAKSMAIRFGRATAEEWNQPILDKAKLRMEFKKRSGTIMFPTTHDITPFNAWESITTLRKMLQVGNHVLVVTKPNTTVVDMCMLLKEFKSQILFRFTIGSADDDVLLFWEPGAPRFHERMAALRYAFDHGFKTSVSCEPMLDDKIEDVVHAVSPYVTDSIWIGKANKLKQRVSVNCPGDKEAMARAVELIAMQSDVKIKALYERLKLHPKIKWKESIKSVVGLELAKKAGLDI